MRRVRFSVSAVAVGIAIVSAGIGVARGQSDAKSAWIGVKVMPKLDAEARVGDTTIDSSQWSIPFAVQDVNGDWLYVGDHTKGWIKRDQLLTLDEAPAYYTSLINRGEQNAWAYAKRAITWEEKGELDLAIADYGEELRLDPTALTYNNRGNVLNDKKEYDKAIADFDQAIRLDPNHASAYNNRGIAWKQKGEYDKAIADYDQAIRIDSNYTRAYYNRGNALKHEGEYGEATADYEKTIRIDPHFADPYNALAWLRATCTDTKFRDGDKAVAYATKAGELDSWRDGNDWDNLAVAYAEKGDFDIAIKYERTAIGLRANDADFAKEVNKHLEFFRQKKPWRA